jgi:hypothetical protein
VGEPGRSVPTMSEPLPADLPHAATRDVAGKVAAQIAVCRRSVGLSGPASLGVLELRGRRAALQTVLRGLTGRRLAVGDAVHASGAWWCLLTSYRALALAPPAARHDVWALLRNATRETPGASTVDLSADYAAITLAGPRAGALAVAAGLGERPPGRAGLVCGARPAVVLREHADRCLVVVPRAHADVAWAELLAAGAALGAAGVDAYALGLLAAGERVTGCLPARAELTVA